jgi:methyltransferase
VTWAGGLLLIVAAQRLAELAWSARNERRLRAMGAIEAGRAHYPVIIGLHTAWLAALFWFGWSQPVAPGWLALFLILQLARLWVLASLGERWTTRVLVLPGAPLVSGGPYRFVRHPNYFVVALEIVVLPLALGLPGLAAVFGVANAAVLAWRIKVEERALRPPGSA